MFQAAKLHWTERLNRELDDACPPDPLFDMDTAPTVTATTEEQEIDAEMVVEVDHDPTMRYADHGISILPRRPMVNVPLGWGSV